MTQTVGQYELIRRIGSGGMAEVWMGRRASVGGATKSVAIKFMSARVAGDERHRRMFLAEARLSMLMTHSNVVQVFDAGEEDGRLYLVMEWIDGLNLAQLSELRRREGQPWPPRLSGYVVGEVLRGLAYAHHLTHEGQPMCVVHRDISPHNVLVSTSGEVKLADFGVARLASEETSGLHIKGKLRYMAPEHLAGRSREPTVDLFGVGAVLHELLAGARFRDEADEVDLYGQILGGHVPPLTVPGVPPELASLREGLLRAEPRQRIPTAARALEYLSAWAGYRNAAAELGTLCRAAMGVVAPRSGIDSGPTEHSVDGQADTLTPSAATRTSGRVAGAMGSRTSGAAAAATRTSGGGKGVELLPSLAATEAGPAPRPGGRRALLVGGGIVGAGFLLGGIGVAAMRWRDPDAPEGERPRVAVEPAAGSGPTPSPTPAAGPTAAMEEEPVLVEPRGVSPATSDVGATPEGSGDGGTTGGEVGGETTGAEPAEPAEPAPAAVVPEPSRRASAPATVKLGLRNPIRFAYVRFGRRGKSFVVDPRAERSVSAGRHSIWWKESPDAPWRDGGSFTFEAGRQYQVRLTSSGPVAE